MFNRKHTAKAKIVCEKEGPLPHQAPASAEKH